MNPVEIASIDGFNAAKTQGPVSVVFFYKSNLMSKQSFLNNIQSLCYLASTLSVRNLYYFQANELSYILDNYLQVYAHQGILVFRDGNLLDYMEDFNKNDFELILNYPSARGCLNVPVDNDTKIVKKILREEREKGVTVKKVVMGTRTNKVFIYHDDANITIRDVVRAVDMCVGTDDGP